jgi:hypothetical protein
MGAWLLDTEKNESETASWTGAWDQADLGPGDLVSIADPAYAGVRFGGRVAGITLNAEDQAVGITLDAAVTIEAGQTYSLSMALPDLSVGTVSVANGPGSTTQLTFAASEAPLLGAMWVLTASNLAPRQFRIVSRTDKAKNEFDFVALFNDPTKYARIEQNIILPVPNYTALPSGPLPAPTNLTTLEGVTLAGGTTATALCVVSWTAPSDPRVTGYNVQYWGPAQTAWQSAGSVNGPSIDLLGLPPGSFSFRVQALDAIGDLSPWLELDNVSLDGLTTPLPDVTNLRLVYNVNTGFEQLVWDNVTDPRNPAYVVAAGASWDAALVLTTDAVSPFTVPGPGTYWVSAFVNGVYSATPQSITVSGAVITQNVIQTIDFAAKGWPGTFSGSIGVDTSLNALRTSGSGNILTDANILTTPDILNYGGESISGGTYYPGVTLNLGYVGNVSIAIKYQPTGVPVGQNILTIANILASADILGSASTQYVTGYPIIRIATTETGGNPNYGAWQKFAPGTYQAQWVQYGFYLATSDMTTEGYNLAFAVTATVAARIDQYSLTSSSSAATTVTFGQAGVVSTSPLTGTASPFNGGASPGQLPAISWGIVDAQAGDDLIISALSDSAVTFAIWNSGVMASRQLTLFAEGY